MPKRAPPVLEDGDLIQHARWGLNAQAASRQQLKTDESLLGTRWQKFAAATRGTEGYLDLEVGEGKRQPGAVLYGHCIGKPLGIVEVAGSQSFEETDLALLGELHRLAFAAIRPTAGHFCSACRNNRASQAKGDRPLNGSDRRSGWRGTISDSMATMVARSFSTSLGAPYQQCAPVYADNRTPAPRSAHPRPLQSGRNRFSIIQRPCAYPLCDAQPARRLTHRRRSLLHQVLGTVPVDRNTSQCMVCQTGLQTGCVAHKADMNAMTGC